MIILLQQITVFDCWLIDWLSVGLGGFLLVWVGLACVRLTGWLLGLIFFFGVGFGWLTEWFLRQSHEYLLDALWT